MQGKRSRKWVVASAVLALGVTTVAWGRGHRRGFGGPDGPPPGPPHAMVLERLVFPCRGGCFDAGKTCFDNAATAAETCVSGSCATQIATAQTACQAGSTSSDCQAAVNALKTCAQSCLDTLQASASSCHATVSSCVTTCGNS